MKNIWYRPHWRNGLTHGLAILLATISTFFINHQFNQELNACKAVSAVQNTNVKKATEKKCTKLFENLEKDLDPWVYILLGFNTYLLMYGWASGNVSVITAMETKPDENEFKVKRPPTDNEELYLFGYHFAKVLKSETQLVINPELVFFDDFFNFKFTGLVKRDTLYSAILTPYHYLSVKTQDSLRKFLKDLTLNTNDNFHVTEVAQNYLTLATRLGFVPSPKTLKLVAMSSALYKLNCPEIDSLDTLILPDSCATKQFTDPIWQEILLNWTKIAMLVKTESVIKGLYDPKNPKVIANLSEMQNLFNSLFTK